MKRTVLLISLLIFVLNTLQELVDAQEKYKLPKCKTPLTLFIFLGSLEVAEGGGGHAPPLPLLWRHQLAPQPAPSTSGPAPVGGGGMGPASTTRPQLAGEGAGGGGPGGRGGRGGEGGGGGAGDGEGGERGGGGDGLGVPLEAEVEGLEGGRDGGRHWARLCGGGRQ